MAIIRIKKHQCNYVQIDKHCFNDKNLSWKATGLHSYLMGLPDDWTVNSKDLVKRKKDGRISLRGAMKELEKSGYITRKVRRLPDGQLRGWIYTVYEKPHLKSLTQP
ncbi:MAG: hypothetical protein WC373_04755 [Smithella sp.]|jgi:hypothetical protein